MKFTLVLVLGALATSAFAADTNGTLTARQKLIKEHREFILRTGGYVIKPDPGNKAVVIADAQSRVPNTAFRRTIGYLRHAAKINFDLRKSETSSLPTDEDVKALNAAVYIKVVDDAKSATPILLSPDERWALVNVAAIARDKPGEAVLNARFRLALTRAICYACGGGASKRKEVPTAPLTDGLADYDRIIAESLSPDQVSFIGAYLLELGSRPIVRMTYDAACQQGWASLPTNNVQKAIWERIHKLPTEPIKIKPETKKVRE